MYELPERDGGLTRRVSREEIEEKFDFSLVKRDIKAGNVKNKLTD